MSSAAIESAPLTHAGCVREVNEDAYSRVSDKQSGGFGWLFVVADGMGGEAAGELASYTLAVEARDRYAELRESGLDAGAAIEAIFESAHETIVQEAERNPERKGMGTTGVILALEGGVARWGHVGDSRLYVFDGQSIARATRDHSRVQDLVDAGILTPELAESHPDSNVVNRAVGRGQLRVELNDAVGMPVRGHSFLLCSDGLTGVVEDEYLELALRHLPPKVAVEVLVELALQRGAPDNVTVWVVRTAPPEVPWTAAAFRDAVERSTQRGADPVSRTPSNLESRRIKAFVLLVVVLTLAVMVWVLSNASRSTDLGATVDVEPIREGSAAEGSAAGSGEGSAEESVDFVRSSPWFGGPIGASQDAPAVDSVELRRGSGSTGEPGERTGATVGIQPSEPRTP